jgi:Ca2+-binding RTX toxin-like protein
MLMPLLPWNAVQVANTTTNGFQQDSQITRLTNGDIVVAWQENTSGNFDVKFQRFDALGNKLGGETLAHGVNAANQTKAGLTALSGGGFVVSWVDASATVLAQKFSANGAAIGGNIILSAPTLVTSGFVDKLDPPVIQALAGDQFAVVYTTNNFASGTSSVDLVGRIVSAAGVPGSAFNIASSTNGRQATPQVALSATGNLVVTWSTYDSGVTAVKFAMFSAIGTVITPETTMNTDSTSFQELPSVSLLSNGNFVVTWYKENNQGNVGTDIVGQIISPEGDKIGSEFLAATTQIGSQYVSRVVALADGKFLVVYDTVNSGVLGSQMFNGNGTPLGGELTLTNTGDSFFNVADIVALADGRLAVTWTDAALDDYGYAVAMQILDPREGVINGTTSGDTLYGHDAVGDVIFAGNGGDTAYGLAGADVMYGGEGNDFLHGERGDDTIYGGADIDRLYGGAGDDQIYGGANDDTIFMGNGEDFADGGTGFNTLSYFARTQGAIIDMANQEFNAGSAVDDTFVNINRINGSDLGADTLKGDANDNYLVGYGGIDTLQGNDGADTLRGGAGADILSGGAGADKFRYNAVNEGGDEISSLSSLDDFQFLRTAFGNLAGANVAAINFLSRASGNAATTTNHRFIFDQATDTLWYDSNGSNAGGLTMIADIGSNTTLTHLDLLLV